MPDSAIRRKKYLTVNPLDGLWCIRNDKKERGFRHDDPGDRRTLRHDARQHPLLRGGGAALPGARRERLPGLFRGRSCRTAPDPPAADAACAAGRHPRFAARGGGAAADACAAGRGARARARRAGTGGGRLPGDQRRRRGLRRAGCGKISDAAHRAGSAGPGRRRTAAGAGTAAASAGASAGPESLFHALERLPDAGVQRECVGPRHGRRPAGRACLSGADALPRTAAAAALRHDARKMAVRPVCDG